MKRGGGGTTLKEKKRAAQQAMAFCIKAPGGIIGDTPPSVYLFGKDSTLDEMCIGLAHITSVFLIYDAVEYL